jgi:hypothetical protein
MRNPDRIKPIQINLAYGVGGIHIIKKVKLD